MTRGDAFLQEILAHPDDDAPRLIFADWLEEQGDADSVARAELIRVQCALAGGEVPPQQRSTLQRREYQILNEWDHEWVRPIRRAVSTWEYHRGFIAEVGVLADRFLAHAARLFRRLPIQHLRLYPRMYPQSYPDVESINMAALADNEYLGRLRSLDLSDSQLDSQDVRALVVSEHLTSLTDLNLSSNRIGDSGIRALAATPWLGRLECLDLSGNDLGSGGLRVLANALEKWERSPEGLRLKRLELFPQNLSAAAQRVIAESPLLRSLVHS